MFPRIEYPKSAVLDLLRFVENVVNNDHHGTTFFVDVAGSEKVRFAAVLTTIIHDVLTAIFNSTQIISVESKIVTWRLVNFFYFVARDTLSRATLAFLREIAAQRTVAFTSRDTL